MPALTTTATYQNGIILPRIKPAFPVEEVVVVFVPKTSLPTEAMQKQDEAVWQKIEPKYRVIGDKLSRKKFPKLYD